VERLDRELQSVLGLRGSTSNASAEYCRLAREDTALREYEAMTARSEEAGFAAMTLAGRFGVDQRTIFRRIQAARKRAKRSR
jgi:hypothetical protein